MQGTTEDVTPPLQSSCCVVPYLRLCVALPGAVLGVLFSSLLPNGWQYLQSPLPTTQFLPSPSLPPHSTWVPHLPCARNDH